MKDILAGVAPEGGEASGSFELDTQDSEVREFTARLRRRRIARIAMRIVAVCVTLAALCWLACRLFRA